MLTELGTLGPGHFDEEEGEVEIDSKSARQKIVGSISFSGDHDLHWRVGPKSARGFSPQHVWRCWLA